MNQKFHYDTISEAVEQLKKQGFTLDFNLSGTNLHTGEHVFDIDDLEIVDLYRYEGMSDPADEAIVYALASPSGLKGIFVSGYGISMDEASIEALKQLHYKYIHTKS